MLNIPNPSAQTLQAFDALSAKMQLLLDSQQVLETCQTQAPRSFIEHWAMLADDFGPLTANAWLHGQSGKPLYWRYYMPRSTALNLQLTRLPSVRVNFNPVN